MLQKRYPVLMVMFAVAVFLGSIGCFAVNGDPEATLNSTMTADDKGVSIKEDGKEVVLCKN